MKFSICAAAASLVLGVTPALADTTSSEKDSRTMEQKASPSNPGKQDEERTEAHSQPDTPASTGGSTAGPSVPSSLPRSVEDAPKPNDKPTSGEAYRSNENQADSSKSSQ